MLITSNNFSQDKLWIYWKKIQKLSYVYFISWGIYIASFWQTSAYYIIIFVLILAIIAFFKNRYEKNSYSFRALWTYCSIDIVSENFDNNIINKCYEKIVKFEKIFSRFDKNSSLSILNKNKQNEVDLDFVNLLDKSKEIYNLTDWYFNPLFNPKNIGYNLSFEKNDFSINYQKEDLNLNDIKNYWNLIILKDYMNIDFDE